MDAFACRDQLVAAYEHIFRSCTSIRAEDSRGEVDAAYAAGRLWAPVEWSRPRVPLPGVAYATSTTA